MPPQSAGALIGEMGCAGQGRGWIQRGSGACPVTEQRTRRRKWEESGAPRCSSRDAVTPAGSASGAQTRAPPRPLLPPAAHSPPRGLPGGLHPAHHGQHARQPQRGPTLSPQMLHVPQAGSRRAVLLHEPPPRAPQQWRPKTQQPLPMRLRQRTVQWQCPEQALLGVVAKERRRTGLAALPGWRQASGAWHCSAPCCGQCDPTSR